MQQASTSVFITNHSRVAVISAGWHADIVGQARQSLIAELGRQGLPPERVDCFAVPGAFEIPLLAQRIARHGRHAAIAQHQDLLY